MIFNDQNRECIVTLSAAKGLARWAQRCFAALSMTASPHMTSSDNEAGRASGYADVPLSALGRRQAQELGQHFATEALDAIFYSDLQRASTTAGRQATLPAIGLRTC